MLAHDDSVGPAWKEIGDGGVNLPMLINAPVPDLFLLATGILEMWEI